MKNYKQVILIRTDLKMGKGKLAAQVAHASLASYKAVKDEMTARGWEEQGMKKIILKVKDEETLMRYHEECIKRKIPSVLIRDAGLTQIEPGTITSLGVGPWEGNVLDKIFGKLKLL